MKCTEQFKKVGARSSSSCNTSVAAVSCQKKYTSDNPVSGKSRLVLFFRLFSSHLNFVDAAAAAASLKDTNEPSAWIELRNYCCSSSGDNDDDDNDDVQLND